MKVVIIEDEPFTARDLAACILAAEPSAQVIATLSSVQEAIAYFRQQAAPDIIFSDIQLGDGLSFAIFESCEAGIPVIFCTAYDEYALDAFRAAGIDYILKPFTAKSIAAALAKYNAFRSRWTGSPPSYGGLSASFAEGRDTVRRSILVYYRERIMPVEVSDIALFYLKNEVTRLVTFSRQQYIVSKTLEEIGTIAGEPFYRANRQYLVNREAVKDVSQYPGRKLLLNLSISFDDRITVGRVKAGHFLEWLSRK
jgi:two-component system response regulator LytT